MRSQPREAHRMTLATVGTALMLLVGGGVLVGCQTLPVESFTVNTAVDGHDAAPGDGVCEMTAGASNCSLRAAMDEAQQTTGKSLDVTLPGGTYALDASKGPIDVFGASVRLHSSGPATVDAGGAADVFDVGGTLTVDGLTVRGASQAGIAVGSTAGTLVVIGSRIEHNAGSGLSVRSGVAATVFESVVDANGSGGLLDGGIINQGGSLAVIESTIASNHGTGVASQRGTLTGGATAQNPTSTITTSTIDHNQGAPTPCRPTATVCVNGGAGGGGMYVEDGSMSITNSTFADNTVSGFGPANLLIGHDELEEGPGGVIVSTDLHSPTIDVLASTFVDGPVIPTLGTNTFGASLVSSCFPADSGLGDFGDNDNLTLGAPAPCTFFPVGDVYRPAVADAMLGLLADNGGATRTFLPLPGSPLIDHIPSGAANVCDGSVTADQRGVTRPQGTGCDVGSVEVDP
jgi:CSLREA domain-containing protein